MNKLAIAGALVLALGVGGCASFKEWLKDAVPSIACAEAKKEYDDWVLAGRPAVVFKDGKYITIERVAFEAAYSATKKWCAEKGIIIN